MNRPRSRWIRALAVMAGGVAGALVIFGAPANAASSTTGTVVANGGLFMRAGPARADASRGILPDGSSIDIVCQVSGQNIAGSVRTTTAWNRLSNGLYVSDAFVNRPDTLAPCPAVGDVTATGDLSAGVVAAAQAGKQWVAPVPSAVGSGFRTSDRPNHDGVDLSAARNTPIEAVSAGTVITLVCNASNGNCNIDGSVNVQGCGWYVEIQHSSGVVTRYCHMVRRPSVAVGQHVATGQVIGFVGTSGNSSGPHLHFEVHTGAPATRANAINPLPFMQRVGAPLGTTSS